MTKHIAIYIDYDTEEILLKVHNPVHIPSITTPFFIKDKYSKSGRMFNKKNTFEGAVKYIHLIYDKNTDVFTHEITVEKF